MGSLKSTLLAGLKSMKTEKKEELMKPCEPCSPDPYPWGLRLDLNTDALKALGKCASDFKVGEEVIVVAKCEVIGVRQSAGKQTTSESAEFQITDMKIDKGGKES